MLRYAALRCRFIAILASLPLLTPVNGQYFDVRVDVNNAPAQFYEDSDSGGCPVRCSFNLDCFGFYVASSQCRLFTVEAFYADTWVNLASEISMFTRIHEKTQLQFGSCSQVSNRPDIGGRCQTAHDGDANGVYLAGHCSHTRLPAQNYAWWQGQLTAPSNITFVTLYNRLDCCSERLNNFKLLLDGSECNRVIVSTPFASKSVACVGYGSVLRLVTQILPAQPVTICEIEVYSVRLI